MIRVTVKGQAELVAKFRQLSSAMQGDTLVTAALVGAEVLKAESKRIVPVKTGVLRSSITSEISEQTPTRATVDIGHGQQAPYGKYVELGTYRMAAQPFLRPPLITHRAAAETAVAGSLRRMLERVT